MTPYSVLVLLVALERLAELVTAQRHTRWSRARGGVAHGAGRYPVMVVLHAGLPAGCLLETALVHRPFLPWLGRPAFEAVLPGQALRWWCIASLGPRWNTRVIVVPGLPLVERGPYRWLRHPNYLAVVLEGVALPLVRTGWLTASGSTLINVPLLVTRMRRENAALTLAAPG
ncbi:methyltransferase [Kitasatospora sp. GP30]|uniref:isoprenylcysteine carboxyl methyltransferase family protein n=1 Tax=Kitasatospora sp. GP30 TaxID=3035084 RepID=UPI000C7031B0|nr:isoprenylcysteine carboxylmethyltransferase family protein [Kitasatospora sp. GP30]MDH6145196.1 methyltransferase [Kitasatospora sp. GP30]